LIDVDRSNWKRVRFGDVVESVTDRVDDPSKAGVDRYVGLEHLDPGSLTITRWGSPSDVEATKLRFRRGDVVFARRRAYQRKLGTADFEGIASAHSLVLRARAEHVLPAFLPVFLSSSVFMDRAIQISVGSLSPTVNWRSLAIQEFDLPPLDEQKRIADLLWAAESLGRSLRLRADATVAAMSASVESRLASLGAESVPLASLWTGSPDGGCSSPPTVAGEARVLSLAALGPAGYVHGQLKAVERTPEMEAARLSVGDLLVSRSNTIDAVGRAAIFPGESLDVSFPDTMMRLRLDAGLVRSGYVLAVLMSVRGRSHIRKYAAGTSASMKKINRKTLGLLAVPLPSLRTQDAIVDEISRWATVARAQSDGLDAGMQLASRLSSELFGGGR